jgi:hypothetical protein
MKSEALRDYGLDEKDVLVIAMLMGNFFDKEDGLEAKTVLRAVEKDLKSAFLGVKRIDRLKGLGIIETVCNHGRQNLSEVTTIHNSTGLLRSKVLLAGAFLDRICGAEIKSTVESVKNEKAPLEPYRDNIEYLVAQFQRIKILKGDLSEQFIMLAQAFKRRILKSPVDQGKEDRKAELKKLEQEISARLEKTKTVFPFEAFRKERGLTHEEELIILYLLECVVEGCAGNIDCAVEIISETSYERLANRRLLHEDTRLIMEKLVEIRPGNDNPFGNGDCVLKLCDDLAKKLLGEEIQPKDSLYSPHGSSDFFEIITPAVSLDKVILHPETHEAVSLAVSMIRGKASAMLLQWGFAGVDILARIGVGENRAGGGHPAILLFSGSPGTGKTLTAHAIARELGRKIATFNCSRILSKWVGESEKNTKKIFDGYMELSKGAEDPPVLLLNEADQFLQMRGVAEDSVDQMHNRMQNIFLEQIERFDGVLIATTNFTRNIDPAFSRRFHYKIAFKNPGLKERTLLWRAHLPDKCPLATDVNLPALSERYELSGGQISVASRNAAAMAARRGDMLRQTDLVKACEDEISGSFDAKTGRKVGF